MPRSSSSASSSNYSPNINSMSNTCWHARRPRSKPSGRRPFWLSPRPRTCLLYTSPSPRD
eukprot:11031995-Alexandrium_andersonii.AAC.1